MQTKPKSASFAASLLVSVLLLSVVLNAQAAPQSNSQQQSPPSGVMVDPSAAPLQPSAAPPSQAPLPDAPQPEVTAPAQQPASRPLVQQPATQAPLGAAAAEQVRTAGGGASRPAGNAIAPVKQHQYHSLIIKIGAAAAAGIAVGAVYGLSHATSSTPPHAAAAVTK
jgi:hypothetical protein